MEKQTADQVIEQLAQDMKENQTHYYHLISGEVVFMKNERLMRHPMNGMILTDDGKISREHLAQYQHNAQIRFKSEVNPKVQITDIFIVGISFLGEFTDKEFHGSLWQEPAQDTSASGGQELQENGPRGDSASV